ncbi:triacylglycerol lipase [Trichoderma arundinaceum]|uniref:Triacylglycerol lipase n=1 Tax=Trichoderma arundinaceum TaxID=490622 RepID=A0A395NHA9_TRIAR|nr:triacylglycerol lipase [Trichoderma arundinaceum]
MTKWHTYRGPRLSRSLPNLRPSASYRFFSAAKPVLRPSNDPRIRDLGRRILDDYAIIRDNYATPKHPIVLAHGLLGFSELRVSALLPPIEYWHGIKQALTENNCTVITASVPPSGSIEERAAKLAADILAQTASSLDTPRNGQAPTVNIIAHSMGGLDARYMISRLQPLNINIASLVTIATPHRGSPFADYLVERGAGPIHLPRLYGIIRRAGLGTSAFGQLTTRYMREEFNPRVQDDESVRYFSYGAAIDEPSLLGAFRLPHGVVSKAEGDNDGLVSVESSRWGAYKGTLMGVSHLDLINWSNRAAWTMREWMGMKRTFNAVAFYLDVADMLAKEGL